VLVKIVTGFASGSISVLAEGFQSTVDVLASAMILLSVRAAAAPPDERHPYGHGKLENAASLGQLALILGTSAFLLSAAWNRWQHPVMPRVDWGILALSLSIVVNWIVSRRLLAVARRIHSQALEAEAVHLRSDLLSCVGILIGLAAVGLTRWPRLDPVAAAVMTGVVIVSALKLLRETLRPLLDERLPEEEVRRIRGALQADPRVRSFHRLRTRRAGSDRFVDVHVLLDDSLSFPDAHAVAEEVEDAIRAAVPNLDVTVHPEPFAAEIRHQQEAHAPAGRRGRRR
jgi:cation diffusion facilitator family transporter